MLVGNYVIEFGVEHANDFAGLNVGIISSCASLVIQTS